VVVRTDSLRSFEPTFLNRGAALVEETRMSDYEHTQTEADDRDPGAPLGGQFVDRWRRLEPHEQALVAMAIQAIHAGEFEPLRSWDRFADAAIELLPLLSDGSITVDDLHDLALEHARTPMRNVDPRAD
jgi:hypothetical protein